MGVAGTESIDVTKSPASGNKNDDINPYAVVKTPDSPAVIYSTNKESNAKGVLQSNMCLV